MKVAEVVGEYVTHKQLMGMRFCTEARTLKAFCRAMGDIAMTEVQRDRVDAYLAGKGPVTRFWQRKDEVLVSFYRFAITRGYALDGPLALRRVPKPAKVFVPHIYSHEELRRLLKAAAACDNPRSSIESDTCRTLILLLYGAGLRISEGLALSLADVDLSSGIFFHTSKFYKTRLPTNVYAEIDLEANAKALAKCQVAEPAKGNRPWRGDPKFMAQLPSATDSQCSVRRRRPPPYWCALSGARGSHLRGDRFYGEVASSGRPMLTVRSEI
jgi:hypothetical protein